MTNILLSLPVKPSPLHRFEAQNITSDSMVLSWSKFRYTYYKMGLLYEIQILNNQSSGWQTYAIKETKKGDFKTVINNLYSDWQYSVKVRLRSKAADRNNENLWSEASTISIRTDGRPPRRAPQTSLGSFYIESTETQLWLYWGNLPETDHCGPGFHYIVNELSSTGVVK